MKKDFLQLFAAETNLTKATDLDPAISIDFTGRLAGNINTLRKVLGITEMIPMSAGTVINAYKMTVGSIPAQAAEGDTIALTKVERKLAWTKTLTLSKYRKAASAEAIQKVGRDVAINQADEKLVKAVQKDIKSDFFTALATGTGTAAGTNLQTTLAALWAKLQTRFEDEDITPVYFIHPDDVADYLGTAQITMQTAFGLSYIENFLGMGNAFVTTGVTAGNPVATAAENLNGAYVPAGGDLSASFGLTMDETGMIGMTHQMKTDNATVDTLLITGVMFWPEYADGVFKGTITPSAEAKETPGV